MSAMIELKLTSRMRSHVSSVMASMACGAFIPALLMRMSTRPMTSSAVFAKRVMSARTETSATVYPPLRPVAARMSASDDCSSGSLRLARKMSAPASARPRAIAAPRPLFPPVMSATRPERSKGVCFIRVVSRGRGPVSTATTISEGLANFSGGLQSFGGVGLSSTSSTGRFGAAIPAPSGLRRCRCPSACPSLCVGVLQHASVGPLPICQPFSANSRYRIIPRRSPT